MEEIHLNTSVCTVDDGGITVPLVEKYMLKPLADDVVTADANQLV